MNERDKENLEFLLTASPETIKDWFNQMSSDDHDYAVELMDIYEQELNKKAKEIDLKISLYENERLELQLEELNENYTEANNFLDKFKLKK